MPVDYCWLPIQNHNLFKYAQDQESHLWKPSEVKFERMLEEWNKCPGEIKDCVKHILAFFAQVDNIVCENIMDSFTNETKYKEAKLFYGIQTYIEGVHARVYEDTI